MNEEIILIGSRSYETKTRKQRFVPMHQKVKEILMERMEGKRKNCTISKSKDLPEKRRQSGYVFCKVGGNKFTGDYLSKKFKRAYRKAGMPEELHFHCLRHGAATRMIMNGAPLPTVQRILGHTNIQTTMIYTHPDIDSLREAVARL